MIFFKFNKDKFSVIFNVSGWIDVILDFSIVVIFDFIMVIGEIYIDLDIDFGDEKDGLWVIGRRKSCGYMNGGGVELVLNVVSSFIYLRKK